MLSRLRRTLAWVVLASAAGRKNALVAEADVHPHPFGALCRWYNLHFIRASNATSHARLVCLR